MDSDDLDVRGVRGRDFLDERGTVEQPLEAVGAYAAHDPHAIDREGTLWQPQQQRR
jgi:hypothetical protein